MMALSLVLAFGFQVFPKPHELSQAILRDMPSLDFNGDVDRDRAAHRLNIVGEPEELLVRVVAELVGHGGVERQIDRQQTMPLYIVDELRVGQVELGFLPGLSQLAARGNQNAFSGRPDKVGSDLPSSSRWISPA